MYTVGQGGTCRWAWSRWGTCHVSRVQTRGGDAEGGGAAAEPGGGGRGLPVREHAELPAGGLGPAILRTQLRQAAPAEEALGPGQHLQLLSECGQCQQYVLWLLTDHIFISSSTPNLKT